MLRKKLEKRILEIRTLPVNTKELEEKREELVTEMEELLNKAKAETRAMNDDEVSRYEEIKKEIRNIDVTLEAEAEVNKVGDKKPAKEERTLDEIINEELRCILENRATAMNTGTNLEGGFVVNSELVKEIIKELKDRSDVYKFFNATTIKGDTKIPKKTSSGTANWVDENSEQDPTASIPKLTLVELKQHRLYRESAITQQMLNSQEIDLKSFIIDDIVESMIDAVEVAIFTGTGTKQPTGLLSGITKKLSLEARGTITFDDMKKCKAKLKKAAWKKAKWFMHSDTLLVLDLIKDNQGRALLQPDLTEETGYKILGIPVEVTDAMPSIADTGAKCIVALATPNAYHTNTQKTMALHVYNDSTYTRKGLVGYGADLYMDGKIKNDDQAAGIFNKAS
nr:MAG TPA: major capsid protein [Caudoviricetes sp.]